MILPNLPRAPGFTHPPIPPKKPVPKPSHISYFAAIKCRDCQVIRYEHHDAAFHNGFTHYLCGKCGAASGCWVDVKMKATQYAIWWKPWTWKAITYEEVQPNTEGHGPKTTPPAPGR